MNFKDELNSLFNRSGKAPKQSAAPVTPPTSMTPDEATARMLEWFKSPGMDDLQGVFIKKFMAEGANVNGQDDEANTPLLYVAGKEAFSEPIAKYLIELGADINAQNKKGWTPLMYAAALDRSEMLDLFLKVGAKTMPANSDGMKAVDLATSAVAREAIIQAMSREAAETKAKINNLADNAVILDQPVSAMKRLRFKSAGNQPITA